MKKIAKRLVATILAWQVQRLRKKNKITVIAVAGSIGKTSTKFAIATVLQAGKRVRFQAGNYNDIVTVPLVFFGLSEPSVLNPFAWLKTFLTIEQQIKQAFPYDVVVLELGIDGPGQMQQFSRITEVDISVVSAITPEHMEYFQDIDQVAQEELTITTFSKQVLVNSDLVDTKYLPKLPPDIQTYAIHNPANFTVSNLSYSSTGSSFNVVNNEKIVLKAQTTAISEPQIYSICAAVAVAKQLSLTDEQIIEGISKVRPVDGRLNALRGLQDSVIIDDTYNASPQAVKAALDILYRLPAPQKIAILGNMNELGKFSKDSHQQIGLYCDPKQLDLVITIGPDANTYLADAAKQQGCNVVRAENPHDAAEAVKQILQPKAILLAKGSQNGVFAEEAVKELLADPADSSKLVRQNKYWMNIKLKSLKAPDGS